MSAGSDRLERTRLAILEHVHRKDQRRHGRDPDDVALTSGQAQAAGVEPHAEAAHRAARGDSWFDHAREQVEGWWHYHPARMAVDIARPMLSSYAGRKPVQFLGIAAVAGAALFLLRPWKLISATGVLVALVKSPQVASLIMSALSHSENPRDDPPVKR